MVGFANPIKQSIPYLLFSFYDNNWRMVTLILKKRLVVSTDKNFTLFLEQLSYLTIAYQPVLQHATSF